MTHWEAVIDNIEAYDSSDEDRVMYEYSLFYLKWTHWAVKRNIANELIPAFKMMNEVFSESLQIPNP